MGYATKLLGGYSSLLSRYLAINEVCADWQAPMLLLFSSLRTWYLFIYLSRYLKQ